MAPEISNCCGFSLKHGTIIIGVLQSIVAFMFLVLSAAYAEHPHELLDMSDPSITPDVQSLRCVLIIIAVSSALLCLFSILLIFGAETNHPTLLLPWLVFNPLTVIVYIITTLVAIIHHAASSNLAFICGHVAAASAFTLLAGYNIIAVHSFYKHLRSLNF